MGWFDPAAQAMGMPGWGNAINNFAAAANPMMWGQGRSKRMTGAEMPRGQAMTGAEAEPSPMNPAGLVPDTPGIQQPHGLEAALPSAPPTPMTPWGADAGPGPSWMARQSMTPDEVLGRAYSNQAWGMDPHGQGVQAAIGAYAHQLSNPADVERAKAAMIEAGARQMEAENHARALDITANPLKNIGPVLAGAVTHGIPLSGIIPDLRRLGANIPEPAGELGPMEKLGGIGEPGQRLASILQSDKGPATPDLALDAAMSALGPDLLRKNPQLVLEAMQAKYPKQDWNDYLTPEKSFWGWRDTPSRKMFREALLQKGNLRWQ